MSSITDDNGLEENRGKRGGWTVKVDAPSPEEIRACCERIRASWRDPLLRLEMGLPDHRKHYPEE